MNKSLNNCHYKKVLSLNMLFFLINKKQFQQVPPPQMTSHNVYVTYSYRNFTVHDN